MSVKTISAVVAIACLFCGSILAMPTPNNKTINPITKTTSFEGKWNYSVDNAPYEYSKGVLTVAKVQGNYEVTVKVNYSTVKGEQISVKGEKIDFVVYIEGQRVKVGLMFDGDKFSGKAESADGVFPMKGTRSSNK
ncbi:hypothetical protein [Flagellimonas onchidii]|uniref:hypothetical protein n=1 Tax=Flagellimonas onchidii TaxID=2562684 RepID=UPI0010A5AAC8|nr:hypothetical protein [Allomuricauda onchidii]